MSTNFELTTENVRDYLIQGHYNLVGEIINDDEMTGFLCEVVTEDKRTFFKIRIDDTIQFLIFEIYSGITIPEPYRSMAAEYVACESEKYKVGNIRVDMDRGDVYAHVESSFKDSPITTDVFAELELTAYSLFAATYDDLILKLRNTALLPIRFVIISTISNGEEYTTLKARLFLPSAAHTASIKLTELRIYPGGRRNCRMMRSINALSSH